MESNIINKYKLLILSIVKNIDPEIKSVGRPIIHDYNKCIKIIIYDSKNRFIVVKNFRNKYY
jgi:hypothetical protein